MPGLGPGIHAFSEATESWRVRFTTETRRARRNTEKNGTKVLLTISVLLRALRVSVVILLSAAPSG
jgi:hypothetical protein